LVGVALGTLSVVWFAILLWILYFYAIYLLCTRPHDERFVQIYMLIMSILMLPWGLVLIITFCMSATAAHNRRVSSNSETKDG
jgi:uncharacterized membrane protein